MSDAPTARITVALTVTYTCTVLAAAGLLVFVGDKALAGFLVACEVSVVTGIHLARRGPRGPAPTPVDPTVPILDRPGHEPLTTAGVLRVLGGILAVMGVVLGVIGVALAVGH